MLLTLQIATGSRQTGNPCNTTSWCIHRGIRRELCSYGSQRSQRFPRKRKYQEFCKLSQTAIWEPVWQSDVSPSAHKNIPNMISQFTKILGSEGLNIADMTNKSRGGYAYTIIDLESAASREALDELRAIEGVSKVRVIK